MSKLKTNYNAFQFVFFIERMSFSSDFENFDSFSVFSKLNIYIYIYIQIQFKIYIYF